MRNRALFQKKRTSTYIPLTIARRDCVQSVARGFSLYDTAETSRGHLHKKKLCMRTAP